MNYYLIGLILSGLIGIFVLLLIRWKSPRPWLLFQVYILRKKQIVENIVKKELEESKKYKYESFEAFLKDCPVYQIDNSIIGNLIRNLRKAAGSEFQQYVFIRKNSPLDKTAWLRREDLYLVHEKGTYFTPVKSEKQTLYYDIEDSRPLIDMTDEQDWRNGDMCADVVTAVTNSKNMMGLSGEGKTISQAMILAIIGLCALAIGLIILDIYLNGKANENNARAMAELLNQSQQAIRI